MTLRRRLRRRQLHAASLLVDAAARRHLATLPAVRPRRVLLAASNPLMADYVMRAWGCIHGLPNITGSMTIFPAVQDEHRRRAASAELSWITLSRARRQHWDVLILADHMPLVFGASLPKVIVPHGPGPSRLVRGGSYYYDRTRVFLPDGRCVYTYMLDTSRFAADRAMEWVPEYADRIAVVGDLRADEILAARQTREAIRARLGVGSRKLVVLMSTWGDAGLVHRYGAELLPACRRISEEGDFAFAITMHNNLWHGRSGAVSPWADLVRSHRSRHVHLIEPGEDFAPYLAASDAAVTDHTSLAMLYSILKQPMIPVAVPVDLLVEGTFSRWLQQNRRPLRTAGGLLSALSRLDEYAIEDAPVVVDHPGEARARTRSVLESVLNLAG